MRIKDYLTIFTYVIILSGMISTVYAVPSVFDRANYLEARSSFGVEATDVYLVQSNDKPSEKSSKESTPKPGTLVLPNGFQQKEEPKSEKKCMTVCSRWGETCVFDDKRGRKCRRTCKEFAEECF